LFLRKNEFIIYTSCIWWLSPTICYPNSDSSHAIYQLPNLVIEESRLEKLLDATESKVVIRAENWEGSGKNLPDVIQEMAGIQTRKYGGLGSFQTISIRGISGTKVLVYLDDVPLNSAGGGAVDLGKINLEQIEKIEVYKGITPAKFGGNSVGGVIHLISKKGRPP